MIETLLRRRPFLNSFLGVIVCVLVSGCGTDSSDATPAPVPQFNPVLQRASERADQQAGEGAIATYAEAIQSDPQLVTAYFARGNAYHRAGQYQKAVEDFNTVLRHEPRNAAAYFARGQSWQAQGNSRRALSSYTLAIAVEPRQARWYYLRGVAYDGMAAEDEDAGKPARAKQLRSRAQDNYAKARRLDPITNFSQLERS